MPLTLRRHAPLFLLALTLVLVSSSPAQAQAVGGGGFETLASSLLAFFTGNFARVCFALAIVFLGYQCLAMGHRLGERAMMVALGIALISGVATILGIIGVGGGGVTIGIGI